MAKPQTRASVGRAPSPPNRPGKGASAAAKAAYESALEQYKVDAAAHKKKFDLAPLGTDSILSVPEITGGPATVESISLAENVERQKLAISAGQSELEARGETGNTDLLEELATGAFVKMTTPQSGPERKRSRGLGTVFGDPNFGSDPKITEAAIGTIARAPTAEQKKRGPRSRQNIQLTGRSSTILTSPGGVLNGSILSGG